MNTIASRNEGGGINPCVCRTARWNPFAFQSFAAPPNDQKEESNPKRVESVDSVIVAYDQSVREKHQQSRADRGANIKTRRL